MPGKQYSVSMKKTKIKGLGDVVHVITKKLKIKECEGCEKRRKILNKIRIPKFKT